MNDPSRAFKIFDKQSNATSGEMPPLALLGILPDKPHLLLRTTEATEEGKTYVLQCLEGRKDTKALVKMMTIIITRTMMKMMRMMKTVRMMKSSLS